MVFVAVFAMASMALAACGNDDDDPNGGDAVATLGDLEIYEPSIRYTLGTNAAAYFRVTNSGEDDRLVGVRSPVTERIELHETITEGATGRMQQVEDGLSVPGGDELRLESGGYHVMLMELPRELEQGEEIDLELVFEEAGEVTIAATVEIPGGGEGNGHEEDDHSDH